MSLPHSHIPPTGVFGSTSRYPVTTRSARPVTLAATPVLPTGPMRVYSCGITPYDVTHLGHASAYLWTDLLISVARATGASAQLCRNVTDIDDVLTSAARSRGEAFDDMALYQEYLFDRDMRSLAVAEPALTPHARWYVGAVQRLGAALLSAGAAYESGGYVYFRGGAVPGRAGLHEGEAMRLSEEYGDQADPGERESPFDVPVWRPSGEDDPAWPSPWGWGRPGWHAECTAMAISCLGSSVDVVVGGSDLTFPHHAYQAAMAEAATGVAPFARAALRVGEVRHQDGKMAKSTDNLVLVSDLVERFGGAVVRLGVLNRPWAQPWDYSPGVFEKAADDLAALQGAAATPGPDEQARQHVLDLLCGDLDVPSAVSFARQTGADAARALIELLKLGAAF